MNKQNNIIWIDWVKFICIFFVYWCHVVQLGSNVSPINIPYGFFFVNAFFFVSGYLIFSKQMEKNEIGRNIKEFWNTNIAGRGMLPNIIFKIAIPSVIFSILDYIPKVMIRGGEMSLWMFFYENFLRGTSWFTCVLTISEIIIFILLVTRLKKIHYYLLLGVAITMIGKYLQDSNYLILENKYLPWFYKSGMIATIFLVIGGLFQKYEKKFDDLLLGGVKYYYL